MRISDWSSDVCSSDLSGNSFHTMRSDGVRGGGTNDVVISNNYFTDFHPVGADHPDAIQLWTTNTTESARNISITGNVFERGDGDIIQGIFLRDQSGGKLPYRSEEHTSELQSLMRISYAVFCLKKKQQKQTQHHPNYTHNKQKQDPKTNT